MSRDEARGLVARRELRSLLPDVYAPRPVPNPSKLFLAERPSNAPGSAVLCSVEGSRPILVEVQALVSSSTYGSSRRMATAR